jgi:hypothetical protein
VDGHQRPSVAISGHRWLPRVTQGSTRRTALKHAKLSVSSFAEGKSPSSIILGAHLMREAMGAHQCPSSALREVSELDLNLDLDLKCPSSIFSGHT